VKGKNTPEKCAERRKNYGYSEAKYERMEKNLCNFVDKHQYKLLTDWKKG
jgi:hypothetical protein